MKREIPAAEAKLEKELQALGLTAPRVTPERIDQLIKSTEFIMLPGNSHMICKLTLLNGFSVIGESKTVSAENFNAEKAEEISFRSARDKIWPLAGLLLAEDLYQGRDPVPDHIAAQPEHIQRVWTELNQTMRRLKSLVPLVQDPAQLTAMGVDDQEIELLTKQADLMKQYSEVLQQRLARIGL